VILCSGIVSLLEQLLNVRAPTLTSTQQPNLLGDGASELRLLCLGKASGFFRKSTHVVLDVLEGEPILGHAPVLPDPRNSLQCHWPSSGRRTPNRSNTKILWTSLNIICSLIKFAIVDRFADGYRLIAIVIDLGLPTALPAPR
jgi:hypothetical protein